MINGQTTPILAVGGLLYCPSRGEDTGADFLLHACDGLSHACYFTCKIRVKTVLDNTAEELNGPNDDLGILLFPADDLCRVHRILCPEFQIV